MFEGKAFTAREVRKVLPMIESIIKDVIAAHTDIEQMLEEIEKHGEITTAKLTANPLVNEAVDRLNRYVEEIEKYGGMVKDLKLGTVDFAGIVDGKTVWICWTLNDNNIYYHELKHQCTHRHNIYDHI